jgi:S-adenosylmethionine-diacylgycerolhomoserine-N-methlytransferase
MSGFYRYHAHIYQATRWSFLFGRETLIQKLKLPLTNNLHLLEIGCGTGHNLSNLAEKYPNMRLTGVDISPEMLQVATTRTQKWANRVQLLNMDFASEELPANLPQPDIIVVSYCLTMINPGFDAVIRQAAKVLASGGKIAVVDFHNSPYSWFRRWMQFNHVRMEAHITPVLQSFFPNASLWVNRAYNGIWNYFIFIGEK